jgi:hypothetical protein
VSITAPQGYGRIQAAGLVLLAALACNKAPAPSPAPSGGTDSAGAPIQSMIESGRLDEAAAQLSGREQDAETLYLTGRLWAARAVTAPLPTPPPVASPLPRGASLPPAPEFKPEEIQAVSY